MKIFFNIVLLLITSVCIGSPSLTITLENDKNFPSYMVVGGPSASIAYDIANNTGGPLSFTRDEINLALIPITSTFELIDPENGTCANLPNGQTCKLTITLDPKTCASVQDLQTGPEIDLNFGPVIQPIMPLTPQQISVRVFPQLKCKHF